MSVSSDDGSSFSDVDSELLEKKNRKSNKIHIKDDISNISDDANNLDEFIIKHKCDYGSKLETHMMWNGKDTNILFKVEDNEYEEYLRLYIDEAQKNFGNLHILEKPKNVGPLYFDFDFKQKKNKRFITQEMIHNIIKCINKKIKKNFKLSSDKEELQSFVLIKKNLSKKKDVYSDGFHIHYPKLTLECIDKFLIFEEAKNYIIEKNVFSDLYENLDYDNIESANKAIFDSSIIKQNKWFMLGSGKYNNASKTNQHYAIEWVYDEDGDEDDTEFTIAKTIQLLSIRNPKNLLKYKKITEYKNSDDIKEKHSHIFSMYLKKDSNEQFNVKNLFIKNDNVKENNDDNDDDNNNENSKLRKEINANLKKILDSGNVDANDVDTAKKLVKMFNKERSTEYNSWITVGWALYNVSPLLLPEFIDFSKKCPKKFSLNACNKVWNDCVVKTHQSGGYGIPSLCKWAKDDNIDDYKLYLTSKINKILENADINTDYDIACVIREIYKHEYVCSSIGKNVWYQYDKHKWKRIECANTLSIKISTDVTKEFALLSSSHMAKCSSAQGRAADDCISKSTNITKLIMRLKKKNYKDTIIKEASNMFYDDEFEEKLDSNPNLIGFKNGVYDLVGKMFRKGCPEDYVSKSIKYSYKEFTPDHEEVKEVEDLFSTIQPEKDMKLFLMCYLASLLEGGNKDQKLMILIGVGANGKGTMLDLLSLAFEAYYGTVPITLLTQKRKGSSNATPELADKQNVRALGMQETEPDDKLHVSFMKELTGQDKIMARPLYGDPFYYTPQFKIMIACNALPEIDSDDNGTWRRIMVIDFTQVFTSRPNPNNKNERKAKLGLRERLPFLKEAFMWMLINIYFPIYKEKGLDTLTPERVLLATNKYKKNSNIYEEFIQNNYEITNNMDDKVLKEVVIETFKEWSTKMYNHKKDITVKKLTAYIENSKMKIGKTYVHGIKFVTSNPNKNDFDDMNDIDNAANGIIKTDNSNNNKDTNKKSNEKSNEKSDDILIKKPDNTSIVESDEESNEESDYESETDEESDNEE